jgi:hypothetical protein
MITASERAKTVHALDRSTTVTGCSIPNSHNNQVTNDIQCTPISEIHVIAMSLLVSAKIKSNHYCVARMA